jgi:hypothetical protein
VNYSEVVKLQSPIDHSGTAASCPKCGFEQDGGLECGRCGIIFSKYKPPIDLEAEFCRSDHRTEEPVKGGRLSSVIRTLPWLSVGITATVLVLILKQGPPLAVQTDPEAAQRVAEKMAQLQLAMQSHQRLSASLNEAELNQWIRENLAIASTQEAQQAGIPVPIGHEATVKEVRSAMKEITIHLAGNQLQAYARFVMYGKEVSLQLDGALETQSGYIRLKPSAGKIGSLPIPSFTLGRVVHELFDSPQHRENFQLPPEVASVRVENSSLVIVTR